MHWDLKPGNMLFGSDGVLRVIDFGLTWQFEYPEGTKLAPWTRNVVTRLYRAPEILYGSHSYTQSVDIWSAGCVMAEMVLKDFLFRGDGEIDQLTKIFKTLGNGNEQTWPGVSSLPNYMEFECEQIEGGLPSLFPDQSDGFKRLISGMVSLDPAKRLTVEECLAHEYFTEEPAACSPSEMPIVEAKMEPLDTFSDSE